MVQRDVERITGPRQFAATLRRIAEAIDAGQSFQIQVQGKRFTVPATAELSIEHEIEAGREELELQFRWQGGSSAGG